MNFIEKSVTQERISIIKEDVTRKIMSEGWGKQGRNVDVKIKNFTHCWVTEHAFKDILIDRGIWFRNRGQYVGDSQGAGADFIVKIEGKEVSVGLRSVAEKSLTMWKSVAYPDDRFREEQDKIGDYHIVCHNKDGVVRFYGIISKNRLLECMGNVVRKYSPLNQEYFRTIPLDEFKFDLLSVLLEKMEKV
jgi:hypothetical protein